MFASSFTAWISLRSLALTLAFSGGFWLGTASLAQTALTGTEWDQDLSQRLGALDWRDEDRFPQACAPAQEGPGLSEAEGIKTHDAQALDGLTTAPSAFLIVEGRLVDVYDGRARWFLNFGDDYRTDFTASLQNDALRAVRRYWPDPAQWIGKRVRVSGYADVWNGLFIEWTFPGQFCFLDPLPTEA